MIQEIKAKEGNWLWNYKEPIGNWDFCKTISYDDKFDFNKDLDKSWKEISNEEKESKEKEQENWRKENNLE